MLAFSATEMLRVIELLNLTQKVSICAIQVTTATHRHMSNSISLFASA